MTTLRQAAGSPDFAVSIVACGPLPQDAGGGAVYAVAVQQPVQSWTVLRSHDEFRAVSDALAQSVPEVPPCPQIRPLIPAEQQQATLVASRNELQEWLSVMLSNPRARESGNVRDFLTSNANLILPQYEGVVSWTQFGSAALPAAPAPAAPAATATTTTAAEHHPSHHHPAGMGGQVYDMEMDDMFLADDDGAALQEDQDDFDEDAVPAASVRYKPCDEEVTDEDELAIMAGDVEMVEDVGSLAQSLGASHLGRSLQLQAELKHRGNAAAASENSHNHRGAQPAVQGLTIGGGVASHQLPGAGGIGGAISMAAANGSDAFNRRPLESPPRLDSFRMLRVIGKGSFGKVFLVREIRTNQIYALKVLRKDNIIKRNQVEHTKTERSVLGYVRHPFIVGMNMAFQSRDKLYFVLDYCAGGELFFHLGREGRFPEHRARFYAAEIILAIQYVHSLDIVYRDLKPENVLLSAEGHIRLTDFGLSKEGISASSSGAYSFCGTPEYLAPEILNRQGHGRAVDWWSLGALLYEMLTGLPPFYCQDRDKLFEKIRKSELNYPPSLSRPSVGVLKGLLTKDPTRRLGSGAEDAAEIQRHEFFVPIDWDRLSKGEVSPPWRPNINGVLDTSQFDREFTSMPVMSPHSMQRVHGFGATPNDSHFEGFTFTDKGLLHGPGTQT